MNVKIGTNIKALRKRDDITQEKLADALGVTGQAVSKWESGSSYPDIEYITPLANYFNVTIDYLFDHDTTEKRRKIDEYCEKYDEIGREWGNAQEQIDLMRKALAEFPAEEKLLIRLASALDIKCGTTYGHYLQHNEDENGKTYPVWDYERHKSYDYWEESVKIMEELLANSTDDTIRGKCRYTLVNTYARIGEKEKAMEIVNQCDEIYNSKQSLLATAFDGKDKIMNSQRLLTLLLHDIWRHLWYLAIDYVKDKDEIDKTIEIIVNLNKHVYKNCDYGFYHFDLKELYITYSMRLAFENRIDETFEALENAYEHAKKFDEYFDELRANKEVKYNSPYLDMVVDTDEKAAFANNSLRVLKILERKDSIHYQKLYYHPRFVELVSRIKADISGSEE